MPGTWNHLKRLFWISAQTGGLADDEPDTSGALSEIMGSLRDLVGVQGWLVVDRDGRVRASELPAMLGSEAVGELGAKVYEVSQAVHDRPVSATVDYEDHSFHLRLLPSGTIGALSLATAERPALEMALNLVSKRVAQKLEPPPDSAAPQTMRRGARGRPGRAMTLGLPLVLVAIALFFGYRRFASPSPASAHITSAKSDVTSKHTGPVVIRVAADPWSGYSTFREEPRLKAALAKDQISVNYLDEEKYYDQDQRMRALGEGEIDMALTTLDAFLQHGAHHLQDGKYPGVIVFGIDESAGGDAIFLEKGLESFDDVKQGAKVCFAEGTPSEHLWDFTSLMFAGLETGIEKKPGLVAEDCWKKLEAKQVQIAVLWQPFTALAEKAGYTKVFATGGQADDVILDIAVANRRFIREHETAMRKLVKAYFDTIQSYLDDETGHGTFITKDCGPDCANDQALGKQVLNGIDFLTIEENLCLWFGKCGTPSKLEPRVGKTAKLLVAKNKLRVDQIPEPASIIDDRFVVALRSARDANAALAAEVAGPDAEHLTPSPLAVPETRYEYMVPGAESAPVSAAIGTLRLPSVYFHEGSYRLDDNAVSVVEAIAERLRNFPALCVRVAGYTNTNGDREANRKLSYLRAEIITNQLNHLDPEAFPKNRFAIEGRGAATPVLRHGDEDARASRRTEFTLFDCKGAGGSRALSKP